MSPTETELLRVIVRAIRRVEVTLMTLGAVYCFENHATGPGWAFVGMAVVTGFFASRVVP